MHGRSGDATGVPIGSRRQRERGGRDPTHRGAQRAGLPAAVRITHLQRVVTGGRHVGDRPTVGRADLAVVGRETAAGEPGVVIVDALATVEPAVLCLASGAQGTLTRSGWPRRMARYVATRHVDRDR